MESDKFGRGKLDNQLISIEFVCHGNILRGIPIGLSFIGMEKAEKRGLTYKI